MVDKFEHLRLPHLPDVFLRKKSGIRTGYQGGNRTKDNFALEMFQAFNEIQKNHKEQKKKYEGYLDPNLILKINVNQDVSEKSFRDALKNAGIEVIAPSPDKKGYWVVSTLDEDGSTFLGRFKKYIEEDMYKYFNALDVPSEISPEEKVSETLKEEPLTDCEFSYLDVEIWRMKDLKLEMFLQQFCDLINLRGGKISDQLTTKSFCLLRVYANKQLLEEMLTIKEVAYIDRIPKVEIGNRLAVDIQELEIEGEPADDSTGILIVDSGILSGHPLLISAVKDEIALATKNSKEIEENEPYDDIGHGTEVAGVALYGDLKSCIDKKRFTPEIWIFSAKVMFRDEDGFATFNEEELLEHQLISAINYFVNNYPNCRVVNLSFGDSRRRMFKSRRQFNLASLVDELAKEYNVIFVISAGNFDFDIHDDYPNYLLEEANDRVKIIDPATSALGLTVGSLCNYRMNEPNTLDRIIPRFEEFPSPITRVGLGYRGMIKPEIVELGGGFGDENDVITINPRWIEEGRLFTLSCGTSMSAPKVSHCLARIINEYPHLSNNMIKALLLSSTSIPSMRPSGLKSIHTKSSDEEIKDLLKIYGYGKPNLEKSLFSESNRVLLMHENKIQLNNFHVYPFYLPEEFIIIRGEKSISVTLVYDPPVNKNRIDYLGVTFETHLYQNMDVEEVVELHKRIEINEGYEYEEDIEESENEEEIKKSKIKLRPGINLRKKGSHQKAIKRYKGVPGIDISKPLVLVVICQDRWVDEEDYLQDYSVVVAIEHSESVDIYNQIRLRNRERIRV